MTAKCKESVWECDMPWVTPEHKAETSMVNEPCSSLIFPLCVVGVKGIGARLESGSLHLCSRTLGCRSVFSRWNKAERSKTIVHLKLTHSKIKRYQKVTSTPATTIDVRRDIKKGQNQSTVLTSNTIQLKLICNFPKKNRENKIWTCDPYVPNVVLYQAELLPDDLSTIELTI